MICLECRQRADQQKGCGIACSAGCDCQHRARRHDVKDESTLGESNEE